MIYLCQVLLQLYEFLTWHFLQLVNFYSEKNMNNVSFTAVQSIFFLLFLLSVWLIVYKIVKSESESVNYNGGEG